MNNSYKSYTITEATKKLERYCSYQDRCHKEVRLKLKEMRMIPEAADQIIVHLIEQDFLNEERFSIQFAKGKFRIKNWGKYRIRRELTKREISKYNIELALGKIDEDLYLNSFHELAQKRWSELDKENNVQKKKRKLADYLLYRGWEHQLVYDKISELSRSRN